MSAGPDAFARALHARIVGHLERRGAEQSTIAQGAGEDSDHAIAGFSPAPASVASAVPAAVLVPIVARSEGPTLLLTRRAAHLRKHAGQSSFPGGRIDAEDADALAAALREAREEIGLAPERVLPAGFLPPYLTGTGYRIRPVLGVIAPGGPWRPNPAEVEAVFELPLAVALDPAQHVVERRLHQGIERRTYAIRHGEHYVWGATAAIIRLLWRALDGAEIADHGGNGEGPGAHPPRPAVAGGEGS